MFSKAKPDDPRPYEAPARETTLADKRRSVVHEGTTLKGDWSSEGIVDFGGTLIGDLTAEALVLTKSGKVQGNVRAHTVTVEGEIDGTISAIHVAIKAQAQVNADIAAEQISVDTGAQINGHLTIKSR